MTPALAEEGLTAESIGRLARRLARVDVAIQRWTTELGQKARLPDRGPHRRISMQQLASYPEEMILQVLGRALVETAGLEQPKLKGLEALAAKMLQSHRDGSALRSTFHHCVISLGQDSIVELAPEPLRRRGRTPPVQHETKSAFANDAGLSRSLGKPRPASYIANVVAPARMTDVVETHGASVAPARGPMLSTGPQ